jgi:hypothetical protein
MSANQEIDAGGKLWIMPVLLELFAVPFAWISVQMLHDHEPWNAIAEYGLTGIFLAFSGATWAVFRKRIAGLWPWHKLRIARVEVAKLLQENLELQKRIGVSKESLALTVPKQNSLVKPQHNVQCVGFKWIDGEPFKIAALRFQNVPTGKPIGKFEWPRLRAIFYQNSTGQEIVDMCPIQWWDEKDGVTDISADGRDADIASYFEGKWTASETYSDEDTLQTRVHSEELPPGEIWIKAILTGEYGNLCVPHVTGVLTLSEDGRASFIRD